jgi:hypothetical protein
MPVDYKEGERSNLVLSEFHHIVGTAFLISGPFVAGQREGGDAENCAPSFIFSPSTLLYQKEKFIFGTINL